MNLDAAFSALADPTRRAILARLALGEATVLELARPFDMSQPAVSRHIKVLSDAGLILQRVDGTQAAVPAGAGGARRSRPLAGDAAGRALGQLRPAGRAAGRHGFTSNREGEEMSKLTLKTEGDTHVVVTRRFQASPEKVYRAHVEPELIKKWMLGPDGWTMPVCINDARPGGKIRYEWSDGKGGGFHLTGEFISLEPYTPHRACRAHAPARPDARQPCRDALRAGRAGHADDDAHDAARRRDARGDARHRHGRRHGSRATSAWRR